ncbi:leucine aminopeptidase [Cucumis sativus]|uniref:leucine aminopeptidase n=1 Tax=Cucumis sativus TaxID=3659 RepID=UPI0012F4D416|nr:leucine aminopeptidase [Cucumis sativus]XP_031740975.1 leucine aminopeptidase [Cucumis sativus]
MAPVDPHSYTDSTHAQILHYSLSFFFDFPSTLIHASALITLSTSYYGSISLDTRSLIIHSVIDPMSHYPIPFSLSPSDPIKGSLLSITLGGQSALIVTYSTTVESSALQWLSPPQTFNKTHPFVYTQCHPIHARSILPSQDTPAFRIRYSARLNIPQELTAVMAARHVERRPPVAGEAKLLAGGFDLLWADEGRVVEEFTMVHPIAPYLFAFAVGEIAFREVGPRTRVYAESVPSVLDAAAREFAGTEDLIKQGEKLFRRYGWERFDLLVLPPSFPYAGMENPKMVFLTPTVIKGDSTGAHVVAHELAHSWTGNLITNKNNEHFWLNEGFTTYAERRIIEAVQGNDAAALNMGIGWKGWKEDVEKFKDNLEFTKLKTNQEGVDPDDVYSRIPYEKGFQFLWRIERQVGRPEFDKFLREYISIYSFKTIDTETFLDFLIREFPGIEEEIDLELWIEGTGIPPDAQEPVSYLYMKILSLANDFKLGKMPKEEETADWGGRGWELYLENLPRSIEVSQIQALDVRYRFSESKNYDIKVAFLELAISSKYRDCYAEVEKTLKEVGRMRYLRKLYGALTQGPGMEEEKILANRIYSEARESYHPIAQRVVEFMFSKNL